MHCFAGLATGTAATAGAARLEGPANPSKASAAAPVEGV